MIDQLTDAECEITECVARRLNVVIEAVEALRRQIEQHIAAEDGADPVEGPMYPSHAAALRAVKRCEADVQALREDNETLRAERDAAQARVAELEADAALGALVRRVVETHKTVEIVRSSTGYHDVLLNGHIDVHGKRHAIHGGGRKLDDALRAALGESGEAGE